MPINEEPHHRLVLQNEFTHVYSVMVPGLDVTLLHQHDLPYLYVTLGPADIINGIVGKPELHQVLQDGEVHYTPGHFAHIVRTDSGLAFRNITIELVRPQGAPKNLCKDVMLGEPLNCPETQPAVESKKGKKRAPEVAADEDVPYFESDEVRVDLHKVSAGNDYVDAEAKFDVLLESGRQPERRTFSISAWRGCDLDACRAAEAHRRFSRNTLRFSADYVQGWNEGCFFDSIILTKPTLREISH